MKSLLLGMCLVPLVQGQELKLPTEVRGEPSAFVTIQAETSGKAVKFYSLDPGLSVFPAGLLSNPKATVVVAGKPGRYRVLAWTAMADIPSDPAVCVVVVGDGVPPIPPVPPPAPVEDPLAKSIRGIFGGLQESDKVATAAALARVYRQANVESHETLGELLAAMRTAAAGIPTKALRPIRERLSEHLLGVVGDDMEVPLAGDLKVKVKAELGRIATILEGLR